MPADTMTSERGLARVRQIAKEERAAVVAGDTEMVCRLTELLPHSLESLRENGVPNTPEAVVVLDEMRQAHEQADRYLQEQMRSVKLLLQQCATARRTLRAYGKRNGLARVDNRS